MVEAEGGRKEGGTKEGSKMDSGDSRIRSRWKLIFGWRRRRREFNDAQESGAIALIRDFVHLTLSPRKSWILGHNDEKRICATG